MVQILLVSFSFPVALGLKWLCVWYPRDLKELETLKAEKAKATETKAATETE
jgi:hypothetical protein